MSKKIFTEQEILELSKNKYVKNVTAKGITYTNEFKLQSIAEYENGKTSRAIFEDAGFDVNIIGIKRIDSASLRWRKAYNDKGILGLEDTRTLNSGRTLNRDLTVEEILAKKDAEIAYLKAELELIKKLELQERQVISKKIPSSIIFNLIQNLIKNFNLKNMTRHLCKIANVSASGYYKFLSNFRARRIKEHKDLKSKEIILKAFNYRGYKKGSRSIKMILENKFHIIMNRKKIQRIMRKYNITCPIRKANPYKRIAKATKEHRVAPNRLNREFKQNIPGKVMLTDITYMPYGNNKIAYLSTIKDSSTNEILAYNLSNSLAIDIVTETINKLVKLKSFKLHKDAFIHSDQGSHYTSPIFQKLLKKNKLGQSMSRRGNCWDNAPQESFFGHMKDEIDYKSCRTIEELKILMAKGIEFRFVSENFRSHKKYHYVFREYPDSKVITVDDDLIYPRNTVERLLSLSYQYPDTVCGNVIRKIHMDGNSFSVYRKWTKVFTMPVNSSLQNVAIGCGGIYYPPHWYGEELFDWKIISEHCPSADDLWLKANELKRRVEVTGGGEFYPRPIELPQTQNNSLQKKNNGKTNLNDKQWKSLNELWKLDELYCINGK